MKPRAPHRSRAPQNRRVRKKGPNPCRRGFRRISYRDSRSNVPRRVPRHRQKPIYRRLRLAGHCLNRSPARKHGPSHRLPIILPSYKTERRLSSHRHRGGTGLLRQRARHPRIDPSNRSHERKPLPKLLEKLRLARPRKHGLNHSVPRHPRVRPKKNARSSKPWP